MAVCTALALAACHGPLASNGAPRRLSGQDVIIDPETGCQYVVIYQDGVFPRLNSDGEPMCAHNSGAGLRGTVETLPGDVR